MTVPPLSDQVGGPVGGGAGPVPPAGEELADAVVFAVTAVPGVAGMHSGRFGEVATYLPGRRVSGVRVRSELVEVHVTVQWGFDLLPTADAIRTVAELVAARPVDVVIQDVLGPLEVGPANPA